MLCRFLMARDNDLAAAAKMCRESFAFRKLHVPRALNECGSFTVESDAPLDGAALEGRWSWRCFESPADASSLRARLALMHAPDKLMPTITAADGSPVFISRFGALDVDGIATESLADPLVMRIVAHLEDCLQTCRSRGRAQHRIVRARAVLDLAGLRVFAAIRRLRLLKQIFSIGQAIYPEGIHSVTIINAPRAFATFWSVFSLILDDAMRAKILIVGTDYAAALKDHANIVVTAQLPKSMGGQAENDMLPLTLPVEKGVGQTLRDANEPPFLVEAFEP
ncbi:CRAL-TRIO domain-containing protein [Pelagophyceae sp. CCMP2097]|nr:CRAL-TRIO domain-containing protein [Pelagophyceae sp. CCMP2097]